MRRPEQSVEAGGTAAAGVARAPARRRPKDRKATIVAVACELFAERGFAAVGIKEIADRVGITGGAIYRHFLDKDALLEAVALAAIDRFIDTAVSADTPALLTPRQSLARLVERMVQSTLDEPAWLTAYLRETYRLDRSAHREMVHRQNAWTGLWSSAIRAAHSDLDGIAVVTRRNAVFGALAAVGEGPLPLAGPAMERVLSDALLSMLLSPVSTAPPTMEPTPSWSPPRTRRDEILTAALALFRQYGYHGVGIDQIAEVVGLAGPSVYAHYASKTDILIDGYYRASAAVDVGASAALRTAASADQALAGLMRSYVDAAFENTDFLIVGTRELHAMEAADQPLWPRRRQAIRDLWSAVLREVRHELSEGESRALVHHALPVIVNVALNRRHDRPTQTEVVSLIEAFILNHRPRDTEASQ